MIDRHWSQKRSWTVDMDERNYCMNPYLLDTPEKVDAANWMGEKVDQWWKLGDHVPYDVDALIASEDGKKDTIDRVSTALLKCCRTMLGKWA